MACYYLTTTLSLSEFQETRKRINTEKQLSGKGFVRKQRLETHNTA